MGTLRRSVEYSRHSAVRFPWLLNPQWTDMAVVVGPTVRWVEDDVEDLLTLAPEVLLGYRVRMMLPSVQSLRGFEVSKLVILASDLYSHDQARALFVMGGLVKSRGGKVEKWHVHRVRGIRREY